MDDTTLPDIEFDVSVKKGSEWRTVGTVCKSKSGKSYTCTIDEGQTLEGRFSLFPRKPQKQSWEEIIDSYPSAAEEYGLE